jgi:hypothetical protein
MYKQFKFTYVHQCTQSISNTHGGLGENKMNG